MRPLALACIAACVAPVHRTAVVALPPLPPPLPLDTCAVVERVQRQALALPATCVPWRSRPRVSRCVRATGGAWGLVMEPMQPDADAKRCGAILEAMEFGATSPPFAARPIYVDAKGHASVGGSFTWSSLASVRAFDYDGDGVSELLVTTALAADASVLSIIPSVTSRGAIWQARDGVVIEYGPSAGVAIKSFCDVDGDGRPDLITTRDVHVEGDDGDVTSWTFEGPEWAAHSLASGAFTFDDATADAYTRQSCDGRSLHTATAGMLVHAAVCARIAGERKETIEHDYVARCAELARTHAAGVSLRAVCRADPHGAAPDTIAMPVDLGRFVGR